MAECPICRVNPVRRANAATCAADSCRAAYEAARQRVARARRAGDVVAIADAVADVRPTDVPLAARPDSRDPLRHSRVDAASRFDASVPSLLVATNDDRSPSWSGTRSTPDALKPVGDRVDAYDHGCPVALVPRQRYERRARADSSASRMVRDTAAEVDLGYWSLVASSDVAWRTGTARSGGLSGRALDALLTLADLDRSSGFDLSSIAVGERDPFAAVDFMLSDDDEMHRARVEFFGRMSRAASLVTDEHGEFPAGGISYSLESMTTRHERFVNAALVASGLTALYDWPATRVDRLDAMRPVWAQLPKRARRVRRGDLGRSTGYGYGARQLGPATPVAAVPGARDRAGYTYVDPHAPSHLDFSLPRGVADERSPVVVAARRRDAAYLEHFPTGMPVRPVFTDGPRVSLNARQGTGTWSRADSVSAMREADAAARAADKTTRLTTE